MKLRLATWNINSVRLRIASVERLLKEHAPDVLCLQEIKCASELFPREAFAAAGYPHAVVHGQPGYHGVATVSRFPLTEIVRHDLNGTGEARHLAVNVVPKARHKGLVVDNFYVPSGGDEPDRKVNAKFGHKLDYLAGMAKWMGAGAEGGTNRVAVGDMNVAPLEHDVWSHKKMLGIVSHTPVEVEAVAKVMAAGDWGDVMRGFVPEAEKLYTWWSYRSADWKTADKGRRLDHVWLNRQASAKATAMTVLKDARGWTQPSDHVPVIVDLEV